LSETPSICLKIISGGQTGADRAALDFAIPHRIPHGGWCPKGRRAEDGVIPAVYALTELGSEEYPPRTEKNVLESDGTVIISLSSVLNGGSLLTLDLARQYRKPVLNIHRETVGPGRILAEFIRGHGIFTLNVAGPRASEEPDIADFVRSVLEEGWRLLTATIPEFGAREPGVHYALRPGAYAVITDEHRRVALVRTPGGVFLPGGGQDQDESLEQALVREVLEECGLHITVLDYLGTADELCCVRGNDVCKRSAFFVAIVSRPEREIPKETDHELLWLPKDQALRGLTHNSQKWALQRALP